MNKIKYLFIIFFIFNTLIYQPYTLNTYIKRNMQVSSNNYYPIWINKDIYVTYKIEISIFKEWNSESYKGIFTWKVQSLNIPNALIQSTIKYENGTLLFNKTFTVNIITRQVNDSEHGFIGITPFWCNPNQLEINNTIILGGIISKGIQNGTVYYHGYTNIRGLAQEVYNVANNDPKRLYNLGCTYDSDTGLLINSNFVDFPLLTDFNFKFQVLGFGYIVDTNIDLGPSNIQWTILFNLPQIGFVSFIIIVVLIIIRKIRES